MKVGSFSEFSDTITRVRKKLSLEAVFVKLRIMKSQDRTSKILLGLLVLGVWGLLLKPMTSVEAQPGTKPPTTKPPTRTSVVVKPKNVPEGRVVMVASEYLGNINQTYTNFVSRINSYEAKGYRIAGYQTSVENNITYHYALLERKQ